MRTVLLQFLRNYSITFLATHRYIYESSKTLFLQFFIYDTIDQNFLFDQLPEGAFSVVILDDLYHHTRGINCIIYESSPFNLMILPLLATIHE